jgi:hypothetical protein
MTKLLGSRAAAHACIAALSVPANNRHLLAAPAVPGSRGEPGRRPGGTTTGRDTVQVAVCYGYRRL